MSAAITVFFRFDDFSATSPLAIDRGLLESFRTFALTVSLATVPDVTTGGYRDPNHLDTAPLAGEKAQLLARASADGTADVLLHGLNHRTLPGVTPHSEFVGLPLEQQLSKIHTGKRYLEAALGSKIEAFVPPWNTYDVATLGALSQAGLFGLSASRYSPGLTESNVSYLPITIEIPDLQRAVAEARQNTAADPVIGVLFHPYDFVESGDARATLSLADLDAQLNWIKNQTDVVVAGVTSLLADRSRFSVQRYLANQPSRLESAYPPWISRTESTLTYLSERAARTRRSRRDAATIGTWILFAAISGGGAYAAWPYLASTVSAMAAAGIPSLLALALAVRGALKGGIGHRAATVCAIFFGASLGILLAS